MEIQCYTTASQLQSDTNATLVGLDDLRKLANVGDAIIEPSRHFTVTGKEFEMTASGAYLINLFVR
ncbi:MULTISPECIES: hypothetical protein [unclassified Pseudomonas]|jgi:hypothetical protein|uniref:hypothetical protein n=1 Tax=unclassified Pseudomonas TaxID=196821 RepID=UPI0008F0C940|nr:MULTISPECIES: hypothetical protein [unclassified Pseudomonas]PMV24369.1 hypothetical protein C1X17_09525 [Pseudomonas sp. FW305-3-2-15-C-TSA2]PMV30082.1 hypothetical protein C1X22_09345 [Pseudomonas sp. DP16D-L5]PMV40378.1 hypothetical protein C1X21_08420 [Pseudomonas sp. FW305-3-2-15-A-LB2]PMV47126.1 hypothetical protein C1X16_08755 [Pseudomonas sp. FW305-3-2-15-C-R2A1]PMV52600.1 hypothetical protein C1X18_09515 [Pseudomonas sp. FW305-3-2-15-C-LB1]